MIFVMPLLCYSNDCAYCRVLFAFWAGSGPDVAILVRNTYSRRITWVMACIGACWLPVGTDFRLMQCTLSDRSQDQKSRKEERTRVCIVTCMPISNSSCAAKKILNLAMVHCERCTSLHLYGMHYYACRAISLLQWIYVVVRKHRGNTQAGNPK